MRFATTIAMMALTIGSTEAIAQHRPEVQNVRSAMRDLDLQKSALQRVLDRDVEVAREIRDAIAVVMEDQEHNAAEKAMGHVRTARRLVEEGPRAVHLGSIVGVAQEMVLNRREWIHSVDLYDMREEYHHRVIHPLTLALAEDLELLADLESEGLELGPELIATRSALARIQRGLMEISDLRYQE